MCQQVQLGIMALPKISIVIPARNEQKELPNCLAAIRAAEKHYPCELEIIVVLNRCTDRTEEIAKQAGCKTVIEDTPNLATIRNAGVRAAIYEWIVTIDADSRMSKNMFAAVAKNLSNERVIGGGVGIYPERWSLGIICTYLCLLPFVIWDRVSAGLFFFRKSDFEAIGGFNPEFHSVEDLDFARRLRDYGKTHGQKFAVLFSSWIITSCRKFDHFGDWYFIRNWKLFYRLLNNLDPEGSKQVWYDFPRK